MKKLLKPEMEFIELNTQDVITTSGGGDTYMFSEDDPTTTSGNAHDAQEYGNGDIPLFNDYTQ